VKRPCAISISVAVLWTATLCFGDDRAPGESPADPPRATVEESSNLHRVRMLLSGDVRALWVGDSWSLLHNTSRLPQGSLLVWPLGRLTAVCAGFRTSGLAPGTDFTGGPGALIPVDSDHGWEAEFNDDSGPARIALPLNDMTKVLGEVGLELNSAWGGPPRIQDLGVQNARVDDGDLPPFTGLASNVRVRPLYYRPRDLDDLATSVVFADQDGSVLRTASLRDGARGFWHLGDNPDSLTPRTPVASQVNAFHLDLPLSARLDLGPRLVVCENPGAPLAGSLDYWFLAGAAFYLTDAGGVREPGYYHSVLATVSWQLDDYATGGPSNGDKRFTDAQLIHWLDVTTLDRAQTPVVILHIASERLEEWESDARVRGIVARFRAALEAIGVADPRFLLVGSYMHRTRQELAPEDRGHVEAFNRALHGIAESEPDCAFVSLYALTDGVYFTTDAVGGQGTQQAARDWLDANGWSTITYGGRTYNLSSGADGGADGVLVNDGLHIGSSPATAFFAKLIADAIEASSCPGDFNGDGSVNTLDVLAFLNAWNAADPRADFNGDGIHDTRDVIAFLNAWAQTC